MLNFLRLVSIASVASLTAMLPAQAKADVTLWKDVGNWSIGFYPNLPGCLAYTSYERGTHFWIGLIKKDDRTLLDVSLMDDAWKSIEPGKEYSVKVYFGDETPWTLEMSGKDYDGSPAINFAFDAYSEKAGLFVEEFQRELGMAWYYQNVQLGRYSLRGTQKAFDEVVACQKSFNEAVSSVSDPFGGPSGSSKTDPFSR